MRKTEFVEGEYYHVFNRGNNKQVIFKEDSDYIRFLFLILHFQSDTPFYNIGRYTLNYVKHRMFNIDEDLIRKITENRKVELVALVLMPNHFHLILKQLRKDGIWQYMQRLQNAYAKYFNTKYKNVGHVFQGVYKSVHVENNEQLLHLSAYIHRNSIELSEWKNKTHLYPWSSFQDFVLENRWERLVSPEIILDQFSNEKEYKDFVDTSGTKVLLNI